MGLLCGLIALGAATAYVPTGWVAIERGRRSPHYAFERVEFRWIWQVGERDIAYDPEGHVLQHTWWERRVYWPPLLLLHGVALVLAGGVLTIVLRWRRRHPKPIG